MLNEKFGRDVRAVRIEVESDESGVRVKLRGEVPSDQAKEAVMREVAERVEGLRFQDFDLNVSGPVSMIGIVAADLSENGAIFTPYLHYAATFDESANHCPSIYDLWAGVRINRLGIDKMPNIKTIALSPNGKTFATGHQNSQIVFWDMPLCQKQSVFQKARDIRSYDMVGALAFSGDGSRGDADLTSQHLLAPRIQQTTADRVFARHLGRRQLRTQALRHDRPLLLHRPSTPPLACENLHTPPHGTLTTYRTDVLRLSVRHLAR